MIIRKTTKQGFNYYLGNLGRWEGLVNNARKFYNDNEVVGIIMNLRTKENGETFSYFK